MTQQNDQSESQPKTTKSRVRYLIPLVLLFVVPVLGYLTYDLVKPLINPCESLFRQTQSSLGAKIELLNIKSEVNIKPEKIQELTERAQIVASNLQYCCTTLSGGERRPEDFIQCKTSTSAFEQGLDQIVELKQASVLKPTGQPAVAESNVEVERQLEATIEQTNLVSVSFNRQIALLQKDQQFERLEELQHVDLTISNQEAEPNDSVLMPNSMPLDSWIKGELNNARDVDYYLIKTPPIHRDYVKIELQNQSTTIAPQITLYNEGKAQVQNDANGTNGGNLTLHRVVEPEQTIYIRVLEYRREQSGRYLLRASMLEHYDKFEPNQSILEAKDIDTDDVIEAGIMDGNDYDYFRFKSEKSGKLQVALENRSTSVAPQMQLYNGNKSRLTNTQDGSNGANLILEYNVTAEQQYYLAVSEYRREQSGSYRLRFVYLDD